MIIASKYLLCVYTLQWSTLLQCTCNCVSNAHNCSFQNYANGIKQTISFLYYHKILQRELFILTYHYGERVLIFLRLLNPVLSSSPRMFLKAFLKMQTGLLLKYYSALTLIFS